MYLGLWVSLYIWVGACVFCLSLFLFVSFYLNVCVFAAPWLTFTKWQAVITDWDTATQTHHSWDLHHGSASPNDNETSHPQQLKHLATDDDYLWTVFDLDGWYAASEHKQVNWYHVSVKEVSECAAPFNAVLSARASDLFKSVKFCPWFMYVRRNCDEAVKRL